MLHEYFEGTSTLLSSGRLSTDQVQIIPAVHNVGVSGHIN